MQRTRIEALKGSPMFGAVLDEVVELIVEQAATVEVPAGDYFFRQGERGNTAYLLERGEVEILKSWQGDEHLLRRLSEGDFFGEVALLDFGDRSASVRALSDSQALVIGARQLKLVAKQNPEQFGLIYMNLGRELARRLRDADERVFREGRETRTTIEGYAYAAI